MEHISDMKLLDYVAGRLATPESEQVREHIAACSPCAGRHKEALATWDALGQWQIDSSAHPVAGRVETLAAESRPDRQPRLTVRVPLRKSIVAALRIAAAILVAVTGGHLLGRYSVPRSPADAPAADRGPRYIAALGFEWSSDLTWTVLQEDAPGGANQQ